MTSGRHVGGSVGMNGGRAKRLVVELQRVEVQLATVAARYVEVGHSFGGGVPRIERLDVYFLLSGLKELSIELPGNSHTREEEIRQPAFAAR